MGAARMRRRRRTRRSVHYKDRVKPVAEGALPSDRPFIHVGPMHSMAGPGPGPQWASRLCGQGASRAPASARSVRSSPLSSANVRATCYSSRSPRQGRLDSRDPRRAEAGDVGRTRQPRVQGPPAQLRRESYEVPHGGLHARAQGAITCINSQQRPLFLFELERGGVCDEAAHASRPCCGGTTPARSPHPQPAAPWSREERDEEESRGMRETRGQERQRNTMRTMIEYV